MIASPARPASLAERTLAPLDALRRAWLRALGGVGRALLRDRELRVAVGATVAVLGCLALALAMPLWALALGPFVWGVPHLLADVRYLVVRPGLHRRRALWLAAGVPLVAAGLGGGVRAGAVAVAGALLVARGGWTRRAAGVALAVTAGVAAWRDPWITDLVMAHAHNLVAVACWALWRPRVRWLHAAPLGLFALAFVALVAGALDPVAFALGGLGARPAGLDLGYHLLWLAPGVAWPLAMRLVLAFAFAQGVHYAVWTRLVPEEDRARPTPRTFAATWRSLRDDFGTWPLVATLAVALGLAAWAAWDLAAARVGYFRLALFHGHLELAALALCWAEGRRPGR